ncbi:DNA-invertase hin [Thalassoglobus neptunius]|uniref:DNA-invertase hin n=1 Tax=Thalassoglobus neptunius TaxID=1938619 RepID=A0A5C5VQI7_9PLAN|nr:recombinase family protein [Thalassoglobus neptunius]TWT40205.1 DNA-invertase hin [Thalassoglobus neptunius]
MSRTQTSNPQIRCAIYCRKSTEDGLDQEFNSLDAQREAGEAFIASQKNEGWVCIPDQYHDGGFSGGNMDRPGLRQLLLDIEAGRVNCVVVYKVDRLSRSLMDFARMMETFEKHNVSFVSVTQQFNTTHSMGRLTLNVLLSFAQFEREIIGERIRDKIAAQRRRGKWTGGIPVLGYDVDRSQPSPKLRVNAEETSRVREIFEMYLKLGSLLSVVVELEQLGWRNKAWMTRKGQPKGDGEFDKGSLHALLTNPIYIGKIRHKTELYAGEHEPIVNEDLFRNVQQQLQRNGRTGGGEVRNKHGALLKGLLVCKACERSMTHTFTGKGTRRYRYYTCTQVIKSGRRSCPTRSLPAAQIEEVVVDQFREMTTDPALRKQVLKQALEDDVTEIKRLRKDRDQLRQQCAWYHTELNRLTVAPEANTDNTSLIADLHDRIAKTARQISKLDQRILEAEQEQLPSEDVEAAFADFAGLWGTLSPQEQARSLALAVKRVEFDSTDSSVEIEFHTEAFHSLTTSSTKETP